MKTRSNAQIVGRPGNLEFLEEHVRHVLIVVLPCVDDDFLDVRTETECFRDDGRFNELWPGAKDRSDLHMLRRLWLCLQRETYLEALLPPARLAGAALVSL